MRAWATTSCAVVWLLGCGDGGAGSGTEAPEDVIELLDLSPLADASSPGADAPLPDSAEPTFDALDSSTATDGLAPRDDGSFSSDAFSDAGLPPPDTRGEADGEGDASSGGRDGSSEVGGGPADAIEDGAEPLDGEALPDAGGPIAWANAQCGDDPPEGATLAAPPKAYTGGTCPTLVADGVTPNVLMTSGVEREFVLIAPTDIAPGESLPVLFAWHWLKGEASSFVNKGELLAAVADQRFIAIIPESKNDIAIDIPFTSTSFAFPWPFFGLLPDARIEEEHVFFDDMLACVSQQLPIDKECVSVAGVSAGALYGALLASARSEHIASFISLSGGIRTDQPFVNSFLRDWVPPTHTLPMLVLWGGAFDSCALLNFQTASFALEDALDAMGSFVVECIHNCGHGVPPIEPPPGESRFAFLWEFAWRHPFWLPPGASPWAAQMPEVAPDWCAIGSGNAIPREGECNEPGCPL